MEILACKLTYKISGNKNLDVFMTSYELVKHYNQYYWSSMDYNWLYFYTPTTSNFLDELKDFCLRSLISIDESTFLLEPCEVKAIFNFNERDLENRICDTDLNSYVNSFMQEIERATSDVSSHSC